jgi:O-antigen/teichoic acid export membrane protein
LFGSQYDLVFVILSAFAIVAFVPLISLGHLALPLVFGPKYVVPAGLVAWLAVGAAVLVLRTAPTLGALAIGDTKGLLYANTVRIAGFIGALIGMRLGLGVVFVAASIAVGELLATCFAVVRLSKLFDVRIRRGLLYVAGTMVCCFAALIYLDYRMKPGRAEETLIVVFTIVACGMGYLLLLSDQGRRHVKELAQSCARYLLDLNKTPGLKDQTSRAHDRRNGT